MRNRTIHGYDTINSEEVWKTLLEDIPPLIVDLEAALAAWPSSDPEGSPPQAPSAV